MLKRFIVFTGYKDQCQGGWDAIDSDHDTQEAAIARGRELTGHRPEWDEPGYDGDYDENDDNEDIDSSMWCEIVDTDANDGKGERIATMGYEVPG